MIQKTLEDGNIRIRPIGMQDTDNVIRWRNSPQVQEHFIDQRPFTREGQEQWLMTQVEPGNVAQFIIELLPEGRAVGSVYLRDIDMTHGKAEYGIFIGEGAARGCGCGTKAAQLILNYAFKTLELHRVFLRVLADNSIAIGSYQKAGFVQEGCFRDGVCIKGQYVDLVFMSILKHEWEAMQK